MSAPLRPTIQGVPIAWGETPFAAFGGRLHLVERPSGLSIADMVASIPELPDGFCTFGTVCINGDVVPRKMWHLVRAKRPSALVPVSVTLHMPVRGGDAKRILILVATIAVLAAATLISGGVLAPFLGAAFAAGGIGATLLSAGVSLAGSLLIAALTPPPVLGAQADGSGDTSKGSASGDDNVIAIGGPIPRVCGTFRVFPSPVCQPVIEIVGDNEIVTQVFALAGPHAWSDVRVGNADVENADDISVETREGWLSDPLLTLITRQAKVTLPQAQLSGHITDLNFSSLDTYQQLTDQSTPEIDLPTWVPAASGVSPDEIWLHLYLGQGLVYPTDLTVQVLLPVRFRIRRRGDAAWVNLPEIHFGDHRQLLLRRAVKIIWGTAPAAPTPPTADGALYAYKRTPQQDAVFGAAPDGWAAHANFSSGSGSDLMSSAGAGNVQNVCLYSDRVEFYLDETTFPKGVYDIEIKRGGTLFNARFTPSTYSYAPGFPFTAGVHDPFYYMVTNASSIYVAPSTPPLGGTPVMLARVLSIWNETPVPKPGNALLCVQATNRALNQISALASGYVRDWNGEAWQAWTTTSNPAPHFRDVLAGDLVSRAVPAVNDTQLVEWRTRCANSGFTFDGIMDGRSMAEALNLLAGAGYARPRKSDRWGVIIDQDRSTQTPAQIFSPRNLSNFRMEKAFADLPDGLIVTYRDRELDYQPTLVVVYRSGFGPGDARRLEAVDLIGPVTEAASIAFAAFMLKSAEARNTFYSGDADIEAVVTETGDLVGVQHDIIDHYAGSAYIKEVITSGGNVTGFRLDSKIPLTSPDDLWSVDDVADLNEMVGCIRSLDFYELPDVDAAADVAGNSTAGAGLAIRCKDGTILTKAITAEAAEDDEVTVVTPFADPGPTVLATGCLANAGSLGREYLRLIVREVRPGRDVTAAVTFVDEAPELWRAAA